MTPTRPTALARLLHDARRRRGWSLRELARRSGVDVAALSRYERGHKVPRADTVEQLAAALDQQVALTGRRSPNQAFVDALCDLQAQALLDDPGLLDQARGQLARLQGRSANAASWTALLDAGVDAVVGVLTSSHPSVRALKADSPLALVVQVDDETRTQLLEDAHAT